MLSSSATCMLQDLRNTILSRSPLVLVVLPDFESVVVRYGSFAKPSQIFKQ